MRLNGLAGRCQWEWCCSLRSHAGRAMPCIKLLPLTPSRGRHWPVGGFQQCGVCVLSSSCSLSVVRFFFVLRAGLLVSFPEGMVSCKPGQELGLLPHYFCGYYSVDLVAWGVGSNRGGGLCLPWMWMMCGVSMFPSVRLAAVVSPGRLLMRWRVGIVRFVRPCARGEFCDASGAEASFLPGRFCAASLCSTLCWY